MPFEKVLECTSNGSKGFKAHAGGECYIGSGAKERAVAQVQAINISMGKKQGSSWAKKLPKK